MSEHNHIKAKLKVTTKEPGIYLMKGANKEILYVGKAKNLKARLSSYFLRQVESYKTYALVNRIEDFEVMLVHNEMEALLLERTLIKHHQPPFNICLRDDKQYPLVKIDIQSKWPRVRKVRKQSDDGSLYLGPFTNVGHLNTLLGMMHRIFPVIKCSEHEFKNATRPCNYYHMKQCLGPCTKPVTEEDYRDVILHASQFLQGKNKSVLKNLRKKMQQAAASENFELAAQLRDQITAFAHVLQQQTVIIGEPISLDIIGFCKQQSQISLHILIVRNGKLMGKNQFLIESILQEKEEALRQFLLQYYEKMEAPKEIYLPFPSSEQNNLQQLLNQNEKRTVSIKVPLRGTKKKLLDMANKNAEYAFTEVLQQIQRQNYVLETIEKLLHLKRTPNRMECIDISNVGGTAIVASNVCFINGKPAKEFYRKYNIEDQAENPDDFGSIRKVVARRLARAVRDDDLPDLLIIDGGKGQLSAALDAYQEYSSLDLDIISLAKSRQNKKSPSGEERSYERVFLPHDATPYPLADGSPELRLLTHIRDEAHRFAIQHHRKRRAKILHSSVLDQVKGVGPQTKKRLFAKFGDLKGIQAASLEDLTNTPGINEKIATEIKKL